MEVQTHYINEITLLMDGIVDIIDEEVVSHQG